MRPNFVDWIALAVVAISALGGMRRGLVVSALSLLGLVAGAYAGSRVAPHLLSGGSRSGWTPVAGLIGAAIGAALLQAVAGLAGSFVRGGLRLTPFRLVDSFGGLVLGAATGVVFVWVVSAAALLVPGQTQFRRDVLQSAVVHRLDQAVPPKKLLNLLARIDPFPSITGPTPPAEVPSPEIAGNAHVRRASISVVRVLGTACGVGIEGSGWFATHDLVVTAAHVVAGEHDTTVEIQGTASLQAATVVAFDSHNDVAVLRVPTASATPLPIADPRPGASADIVGYPEDGPLTDTPSSIGRTAVALTQDAYGNGPVSREITAVSGNIEHGDSGAPAIDESGAVEATIFAARIDASGGYGVPASVVRRVLDSATTAPVSSGSCAAG
ncbi:MAG: MarP family serine protease [Actinobacteria bacterium]|nr:MarP family serine protease [Actinomycetota bacterium]